MNKKLKVFLKKAEEGVSPVIATLMLVLVAAGAAVGVGVFMNGFQEDAESSVNSESPSRELRIGGSSTVYEFSLVAIPEFEKAYPAIKVVLESGGSGAGRDAVCNGNLDIGSASSAVKESHQDKCETLSDGQRMEVFKVATDGVVFVVDPSNDACTGVPSLTQAQAYSIYYHNVNNYGTDALTASAPTSDLDGTGNGANGYVDVVGDVQWGEIPDSAGGLCDKGTTTGVNTIVEIFDRKDPGGTSEAANEFLFGGNGKQLEDFGWNLNDAHQGDGNQGVGKLADGNAGGLWFSSFGYAVGQGWILAEFGIDNPPIVPTADNVGSGVFEATRPIQYMTLGEPSALEKLYIDFVMGSHNNQVFAEGADFESLY